MVVSSFFKNPSFQKSCHAITLGPTGRTLDLPTGRIPVSLVSRVPERNSGYEFLSDNAVAEWSHGFLAKNVPLPASLSAPAQKVFQFLVQQVVGVMNRTGRHKLIYISFGSQGSNVVPEEACQEIIDQASAVKDAVVLFDLPQNAPERLRQLVATGEEDQEPSSSLPLPPNVILSEWPPQQEILATFGRGSAYQTVFWTHCGAGSLSDAVANEVPVALFPLEYDQFGNSRSALKAGLGVDLRPFAKDIGVPVDPELKAPTPEQGIGFSFYT